MILLALSFLLGVLVFQTSSELPSLHYLFLAPAFILVWLKIPRCWPLIIILLGYTWSHVFAFTQLHPKLSPELEGENISIVAVVDDVLIQHHGYSKFIVKLTIASLAKWDNRIPKRLQLSWYRPVQHITSKQRCELVVKLKKPWGYANPGSLDYEKSLFLKGIGARGYIKEGKCFDLHKNSNLIFDARERWLEKFINLSDVYQNSDIMQALTFGYRENINSDQWEVLRKTGTAHLLAISGLHISAISFVVFLCIYKISCLSAMLCNAIPAQRVAAIAALFAAFFYAYLAGFSLPTQRALVMVFVGLSAILLRRPMFNLSVLACALLIVLVVNPLAVLSAGFWMSFLAVLFIFIAIKACKGKPKWVRVIYIQLFLGVALFPISLLFFSEASIVSPIVNLIAIPIVSFLILPLLLLAQFGFIVNVIGVESVFAVIDGLFEWLWWGLQAASDLEFSSWQFVPTLLGVICFEIGLLMLVQAKGFPAKHLAWILIAALYFLKTPSLTKGQMRVTVLDVGQGLSVVVETPNYSMLYDAGMRSISGFNTGAVVVKPYLDWRGISDLDLAIVSHNDNDHAGSMHWLLKYMNVEKLLVSNQAYLYTSKDIDVCRQGDQWQWDGILFKVLHPPKLWQSNDNNRSCVVQISHPTGTVLLTGDIEKIAEDWLIEQYGDNLASELITAPHHGSKSSSSYRFVDLVRPQTVVFSAGYRNRYRFPHATIRQRYEKLGAQPVDTIRQGAVTFLFDPISGIENQTGYRRLNKRYWHSTWEEFTNPIE